LISVIIITQVLYKWNLDITNSEPITNESVIRNDFKSAPKQTSFFSKIGGFFGEVKSSLSEKIKDSNIREKIKQTGEKAIIMAKSTSNYVMEKGKEAYVKIILI
jgi:hypothetical protein